jgi:hypothetical protein
MEGYNSDLWCALRVAGGQSVLPEGHQERRGERIVRRTVTVCKYTGVDWSEEVRKEVIRSTQLSRNLEMFGFRVSFRQSANCNYSAAMARQLEHALLTWKLFQVQVIANLPNLFSR